MQKVCFVQEAGYRSTGGSLANIADRHQSSKLHIMNHTALNLLGNTDVACALDEARARSIAQHNHKATKYTRILQHHINIALFLSY